MGKYSKSQIHPKQVLLVAILLTPFLYQIGQTEQLVELSTSVCNALGDRHECVWTGCVRSDWASGAHGCGAESILCGNPDSCPGGWQYRCCDISAELNVMLSGGGRLAGKRSGSTLATPSTTSTTRQLALLKRIMSARKSSQRGPKKNKQLHNSADLPAMAQIGNAVTVSDNEIYTPDTDLDYDK